MISTSEFDWRDLPETLSVRGGSSGIDPYGTCHYSPSLSSIILGTFSRSIGCFFISVMILSSHECRDWLQWRTKRKISWIEEMPVKLRALLEPFRESNREVLCTFAVDVCIENNQRTISAKGLRRELLSCSYQQNLLTKHTCQKHPSPASSSSRDHWLTLKQDSLLWFFLFVQEYYICRYVIQKSKFKKKHRKNEKLKIKNEKKSENESEEKW